MLPSHQGFICLESLLMRTEAGRREVLVGRSYASWARTYNNRVGLAPTVGGILDLIAENLTLTSAAQQLILNNFGSPFKVLDDDDAQAITTDMILEPQGHGAFIPCFGFLGSIRFPPSTSASGSDLCGMIYQTPNITAMIYSLAQRTNIALRTIATSQARQVDPSLP